MEDFIKHFFSGIVQGISEFFPISSSLHISISEQYFLFSYYEFYSALLQFATVFSLFVYFFWAKKNFFMYAYINCISIFLSAIGTLIVFVLLKKLINVSMLTIPFFIFSNSLLLFFFNVFFLGNKVSNMISHFASLLIGLGQGFSVFPGISRLGITLSIGLIYNLEYFLILHFSFLMSILAAFGLIINCVQSTYSHVFLLEIIALILCSIIGYITSYSGFRILRLNSILLFSIYCFYVHMYILVIYPIIHIMYP